MGGTTHALTTGSGGKKNRSACSSVCIRASSTGLERVTCAPRSVEAFSGAAKLVLGALEGLDLEDLLGKLLLDATEEHDEGVDRLLDGDDRGLGPVGLDFEFDARFERVRDAVPCELDEREQEQLPVRPRQSVRRSESAFSF